MSMDMSMAQHTVYIVETRVYKVTKAAPSAAALLREVKAYGEDLAAQDLPEAECYLHWGTARAVLKEPTGGG